MKRSAALAFAALALSFAGAQASPEPTNGTITLGTWSPSPARVMYNQSPQRNGLVGYVFALPSGADGKGYSLKRTSGPTGLENLDAHFYTSLDSESGACDVGRDLEETSDGETGTICPSESQTGRYAVIVIKAGASTSFSFSIT